MARRWEQLRFALFGNDDLAVVLAEGLCQSGHELDFVVSLPPNEMPTSAFGLRQWSRDQRCNFFEWNGRDDLAPLGASALPQVDFAIASWPLVLAPEVLAIPTHGFIGTHPTPLPLGRGRHPLHWILALGIRSSEQVYFLMDQGIDSGSVLHRQPYQVAASDDLDTLKEKLLSCSKEGARRLGMKLQEKDPFRSTVPQVGKETIFPARDFHQSLIDPRMSVAAIIRLHKSLGASFPGPFLITEQTILEVQEIHEVQGSWIQWLPTGHLTKLSSNVVRLRVDDGCLDIHLEAQDLEKLPNEQMFLKPPSAYGTSAMRLD